MSKLIRSGLGVANIARSILVQKRDFIATVAAINSSNTFLAERERIAKIDPAKFTKADFTDEIRALHLKSQDAHEAAKFPFASDTGSAMIPEVVAAKIINNVILGVFGPNPSLIKHEEDAVKSLFIDPSHIKSVDDKIVSEMSVTFAASTTQANKIAVTCVSNINKNNGEIALASKDSHIFGFEVGQPGEKVTPKDRRTGKLTVEDLERAIEYNSKLGKRTKMIHLDQPTSGDHFYSEDEIRKITVMAHARLIPVSMDVERAVNFLPKIGHDSYYKFTSGCGVDVATLGMHKNGGARSSAVIVLSKKYISDPENLQQRTDAFLKTIGNVTNNKTFITSGWKDMLENKRYQQNAIRANDNSTRIADAISDFTFYRKDHSDNSLSQEGLCIQNYPLTTNMIFAKFPKEFVNIFNKITEGDADNSHIKLRPDRRGITRIVCSHDTPAQEVDSMIQCLKESYEFYKEMELLGRDFSDISDYVFVPKDRKNKVVKKSDLTVDEVRVILKDLIAKVEEAVSLEKKYNGVNRKFTDGERPIVPEVLASIFVKNSEGWHAPYGDDEITHESARVLRNEFGSMSILGKDNPVVFTSSKEQATTCVMQFLKATEESGILVSEGSYLEHCKHGRPVKVLELSGEYKETDKLDPKGVKALLEFHNSNNGKHVPLITGVMIQQPTSKGYIYDPSEIMEIVRVSRDHHVPVVLQTSGFTYELVKNNNSYKKCVTECGIDICTLGFQGLGGGPSAAIVVMDSKHLPYHSDNIDFLNTILSRTVKENGGRQSDSSTLAAGWKEMFEYGLWKDNAIKVNQNVDKIKKEIGSYTFNNEPVIFENENIANNIIVAKLPSEFLKCLNKRGYEFISDADGYTRCQVPYTLTDKEISKFSDDIKSAVKEFADTLSSSVSNPTAARLSGKESTFIRYTQST